MSEFKVGDKVRVVSTGLHPHALVGQTGVVTDTEAVDLWPYDVQFDDGRNEIFNHKEIELVVEAAPQPQVGDRVRLQGSHQVNFKDGEEGRLIEPDIDSEIWPYKIQFDSGRTEIFSRAEFVVLHDEPEEPEDYDMTPDEAWELMSDGQVNVKDSTPSGLRTEALFAAIQSFGVNLGVTTEAIVTRAGVFLTFLEGTND